MNALLRSAIAAALLLGVFFRFYHVDRKVFWDDEIYSAVWIAGDREESVIQVASAAHTAADLQAILRGPSELRRPVVTEVENLAHQDPAHAPLYFVTAHLWSNLVGYSPRALRLLSALIGLLAIPAMFWLCFELFGSRLAGWIGAALIAISPVAVLYSQEVRDYGLWTVTLLLWAASLLRALRTGGPRAWVLSTVLLTFSLYVSVLTLLPVAGFALYVLWNESRPRRRVAAFASLGAGVALFSPWLSAIAKNAGAVSRGTATIVTGHYSPLFVLQKTIGATRLNFADYDFQSSLLNAGLLLPALVLVGYALYVLWRSTPRRTWSFVFLLLVSATLPIVVHDLAFSGMLSAQTRYLIPAFLAADLALVELFVLGISRPASRWATAAAVLFIALVALRASSCVASSRATTWWNKYEERSIPLASVINSAPRPLMLSDNEIGYVLSLAEYLRPDVLVNVRPACYICTAQMPGIPDPAARLSTASDVDPLGPSKALQGEVVRALEHPGQRPRYWCIDVRKNCASTLRLWRWID